MGWCGEYWVKGTKMQDWLRSEFNYSTDERECQVEFISKRGFSVWFLGLHVTNKTTGLDMRFPVVVLVQFRRSSYCFGTEIWTKTIDEDSGPVQPANKKFLQWIDKNCRAPETEYARDWRERSRAFNAVRG